MSYVTIEKQIQSVPEEYLEEVSMYIDFILFKAGKKQKKESESLSAYFGSFEKPLDGMEVQRYMRNEWN